MTFAQILSDAYRRLGNAATPPSDVVTRYKAYANEVMQDIMSQPGLDYLLKREITLASVANQPNYLIPSNLTSQIKEVRDPTHRRVLQPMSLATYRALYPDPTAITGIPEWYVPLGGAAAIDPADASTIYVKSANAGDTTQTAYLEGEQGGLAISTSVALNGVTAAAFPTYVSITHITKFYLSAVTVGQVTLNEDSGVGTLLATLLPGYTFSRQYGLALVPTPASAITYSLDVEAVVTDMVNNTDEPLIPLKFHPMIVHGIRVKEWERRENPAMMQVAQTQYDQMLSQLKYWITLNFSGTPNLRTGMPDTDWQRARLTAY